MIIDNKLFSVRKTERNSKKGQKWELYQGKQLIKMGLFRNFDYFFGQKGMGSGPLQIILIGASFFYMQY